MSEPAEIQSTPGPCRSTLLCNGCHAILVVVSCGFILLFLYTALRRMNYPFSFDQVEGSTVTSVWRIAHGQPLYTHPTPDFVPLPLRPALLLHRCRT